MKKVDLEKKLKAAESALVWYACHSPNHDKQKEFKGVATSLVADKYFKKHGYDEKKVRLIK